MSEALRTLEKAMLLKLVYPTTCTELPLSINYKKSPRLQFIDTGLINYAAKLQQHYFSLSNLSSLHQGKIAEYIVGQELFANSNLMQQSGLTFWVREKPQSSAEVDYVLSYQGKVKAATTGRLRSLHQFINKCEYNFSVRFHAGEHHIDKVTTPEGKSFTLLNLPFYLAGSLHLYLKAGHIQTI